jgi:hypothetical protein
MAEKRKKTPMGEGNILQMLQVGERCTSLKEVSEDVVYRGRHCWGVFFFNQNLEQWHRWP